MAKRKVIPTFYEGMDPELKEVIQEVQAARKAGLIKDPPRRLTDCKALEDLCLSIFQRVHLSGTYQLLKSSAGVKRWVWCGHDYTDKVVKIVEDVAPNLPNLSQLQELRLVATRVSANGVDRLRRIFPCAQVTVYSDEDARKNWKWSQAGYTSEDV